MSSKPPLVINCSAAIPWCLDGEASAWSESQLDALPRYSLPVPALWHLELAMRLKCPLATQDKALAKAAKRLGFLYA